MKASHLIIIIIFIVCVRSLAQEANCVNDDNSNNQISDLYCQLRKKFIDDRLKARISTDQLFKTVVDSKAKIYHVGESHGTTSL